MRSRQITQLDAVLERAQQPVVLRKRDRLGSSHVAALSERLERFDGSSVPHALVRLPVNELEQLHRELDVTQTTWPQLDLILNVLGWNV